MITDHLLFEDVSDEYSAIMEFKRCNQDLDTEPWTFERVSKDKFIAKLNSGRSFFVYSECHFGYFV